MTSLASQIYPFNRWLLRTRCLPTGCSAPQTRLFIDSCLPLGSCIVQRSPLWRLTIGRRIQAFFSSSFSLSLFSPGTFDCAHSFLGLSGTAHELRSVCYLLSVYLLFDTKSRGKCNQPTNPASAHLASVSGWATKEACFGLWNGEGSGGYGSLFVRRSVC